jgi:tRNA C32,U32 (ribose-2'-O)-methylase TrmJ
MIRRLVGRAHPTDREMATLLGVFRRANEKLRRAEGAWDRPRDGSAGDDTTAGDTADREN